MSTMLRGLFSHSLYKHVHKAAHVFIEMLKKIFFLYKNVTEDAFFYKNIHEDAVGFL